MKPLSAILISVIIPTHNRAPVLPRAVHSVLSQTHSHLELIVVDDGSEDETSEFMARVQDPRVRYVRQGHQGVAGARNSGIRKAHGQYIALLDSDDSWEAWKLEIQLAFTHAGGWAISQTEEKWIRNGRRVNPGVRHTKRSGWIFIPSLELCLVSPSCVLMSRKCWEEIGPFDTRLVACEDYDLWLRCSLRYPVGLIPEYLVTRYAGHPDQLSGKIIGLDMYRIMSLCKLLTEADLTPENRRWTELQLRLKGRRYVQGCLKRGKTEEAERILAMMARAGITYQRLPMEK
ncbi:MAG: glycosyltransferase family A protein [Desulfovermiculus sp.]|nr:glycosyltransferase family A protein [Desulfovermiculus sp.]